jgi:outer membrane protein OmpA-like peptidoglycan-associated protein
MSRRSRTRSSSRSAKTAPPVRLSNYTQRRLWLRHDRPVWPFVWRGLLPVLGLLAVAAYALTGFASDSIEATVKREVRQQLDAEGLPWASMEVSGQHVRLGGTPPHEAGGDSALFIARAATCPTWVGRQVCAVDVTEEFSSPVTVGPTVMVQPGPIPVVKACEDTLAAIVQKSQIEFETGQATLSPGSNTVIKELAKAANACPGTLSVEGHTDNTASETSNLALSRARAEAVREALVRAGVRAERLVSQGFGSQQPIADNDNAEDRARNRRIEFRVAGP